VAERVMGLGELQL